MPELTENMKELIAEYEEMDPNLDVASYDEIFLLPTSKYDIEAHHSGRDTTVLDLGAYRLILEKRMPKNQGGLEALWWTLREYEVFI